MKPLNYKYGRIRNGDYRLGLQIRRCYMWDEPVGWAVTLGLLFWVVTVGPKGYI